MRLFGPLVSKEQASSGRGTNSSAIVRGNGSGGEGDFNIATFVALQRAHQEFAGRAEPPSPGTIMPLQAFLSIQTDIIALSIRHRING